MQGMIGFSSIDFNMGYKSLSRSDHRIFVGLLGGRLKMKLFLFLEIENDTFESGGSEILKNLRHFKEELPRK